MSGDKKIQNSILFKKLGEKLFNNFLQNKNKVIILTLVFLLYFFAVVLFQLLKQEPIEEPVVKEQSQLYLLEFISGYRDHEKDFDIEEVRFGEKFLNFTLNIKFKATSTLFIKKLAIDIIIGLKNEYPELESIVIEVLKRDLKNTVTIYGHAYYEREEDRIWWEYR